MEGNGDISQVSDTRKAENFAKPNAENRGIGLQNQKLIIYTFNILVAIQNLENAFSKKIYFYFSRIPC